MCGILGFFKIGAENIELSQVAEQMLDSIEHRGPDERDYKKYHNGLVMGMCRLSIVDVKGAHQPMSTVCEKDSHLNLVFNGEIYNYLEIVEELLDKGHKFNSLRSDTEMILHAFAEWGINCFKKFDGMFAIAIFDELDSTLYLARDRFGEKPLFVLARPNNGFVFASEIKSIQKIDPNYLKIDSEQEYSFLVKGMGNSPQTFFHDLSQVDAGTVLRFNLLGQVSVMTWNRFELIGENKETSKRIELEETFREYFLEAVKERVSNEVPTGLFLSGGLDSSGIGVALSELGSNIKAYSIGFQEGTHDESSYIKLISDHLGIRNEIQYLKEEDLIHNFSEIAKSLDEPIADPSIFPTYMVAKLASKEVKVALGGDGSDELSFGYNFNSGLRNIEFLSQFLNPDTIKFILKIPPFQTHKGLARFRSASEIMALFEDGNDCVTIGLSPFKYERHSKIFKDHLLTKNQLYLSGDKSNLWVDRGQENVRKRYLNGYLKNNILVKTDRMTMLNSIELRSPFLDSKVSDFFLSQEFSSHRYKGISKSFLRSYVEGKLPARVLKKNKSGFGFPISDWLKTEFGIFVGDILSGSTFYPEYLEKDEVLKLLTDHRKGLANNSDMIWSLLIFLKWRENMIKRDTN